MNTYIRKLVERGSQWLDANYPDWEYRINVKTLNLNDCERCVLGQTSGDYNEIVCCDTDKMEDGMMNEYDAADMGFSGPPRWMLLGNHITKRSYHKWFRALTREWRRYVKERRKARVMEEVLA